MPAIAEAMTAPPLAQATAGAVLICGQVTTESLLVDACPGDSAAPGAYARLTAAVLQRTDFAVILHAERRLPMASEFRRVIEASCGLAATRLRVVEAAPLETMLPGIDLLVSFASPALIQGCRSGLKPIQIRRAVSGTASFSYFFPDIDSFAEALASGSLVGRLTLREYEQFEEFCRHVGGDPEPGRGRWNAWRPTGDPIIRQCRYAGLIPPLSLTRRIASALANPFAAWRLLRGNFPPFRTQ
jgi:hypothetical protein